jgi:hypothetical protein
MELYAQIINGKIVPEYTGDYDKLAKIKSGETYKFVITKPRNIKFHRKYFALLNLVFDNQDKFDNQEDMRLYLQMKAGFYKRIETGTGSMILPVSISFGKMDEFEFSEVYNRVMDQVCLFLDIDSESIEREIINYM